jgi:uncharacterized protein YndB with AHSA1/START domain
MTPSRIDVHHHYVTPELVDALARMGALVAIDGLSRYSGFLESDRRAIEADNALRLFPRFGPADPAGGLMQSVTGSTVIRRPREEVFDYLDDLARHEAFTDHFLVDWRITSESSVGVGASARMRARGAGRHPWLEITVVESERPWFTREQGRGGKDGRRRTAGTYRLEEGPGGATAVSFTNEFEPAGLIERLQAPLARAYLRRQNAHALARLKALLEYEVREGKGYSEEVSR